MEKSKIKTIDITALEWFDSVNGNSYFAGSVTVNFGMPGAQTINLPYQYGYGDHYKDIAFKALETAKIITDREHNSNGSAEELWRYCDRKKIILSTTKHENCKKSELMEFTAN